MGLDLSFLLGGGGGVQLPDPVRSYGSALSLAQLARQNRLGDVAEREATRKLEEDDAYRAALPALLQAGFSREAVLQAIQADPRIGQRAVTEADARQKSEADLGKTRAATFKDSVEAKSKAMDDIAAIANAEASKPNPSLSRVRRVAEFYGVPLPPVSGDDPESLRGYIQSLADAGISVKDQIAVKQKDRDFTAGEVEKMWRREFDTGKQAETGRHNKVIEGQGAQRISLDAQRNKQMDSLLVGNMQGQPQEVTVDGKPVMAVYDKTNGTFYDANTRQPLKNISPKVSAATETDLQGVRKNKAGLEKLLRDFKPGYVGIGGAIGTINDQYISQFFDGVGDPNRVKYQQTGATLTNDYIKLVTGATVGQGGEQSRLMKAVPNSKDSPLAYKAKVEEMLANVNELPAIIMNNPNLSPAQKTELLGQVESAPTANGWSAKKVK